MGTAKANTAFALTISGGSVFHGRKDHWAPLTWRLLVTTRRKIMAAAAIHPGEHLAEELRTLDMSAAELARKIDVPTNRVTQILNGERSITGDTALRFAHFFGTSPEFWLNLQSLYELRLAEQRAGRTIKALPTLKRRKSRVEGRPTPVWVERRRPGSKLVPTGGSAPLDTALPRSYVAHDSNELRC